MKTAQDTPRKSYITITIDTPRRQDSQIESAQFLMVGNALPVPTKKSYHDEPQLIVTRPQSAQKHVTTPNPTT